MGERLRRARVEKHLTLEDVEAATKIRVRYLRALEEEDHAELPEPVFARGFLRTYARYLGLDPAEVLADFHGPEEAEESAPVTPKESRYVEALSSGHSGARRFWVGMLLIVVLAGVVYEILGHEGLHPPVRPPAVPRLAPKVHVAPRTAPTTVGPRLTYVGTSFDAKGFATINWSVYGGQGVEVAGVFSGDCWVRATTDGLTVSESTYSAGQNARWDAKQHLTLLLGAPSQVRLTVDGQNFGSAGPDLSPRTLIFSGYPASK